MKKYIPLLIIISLLFSACNFKQKEQNSGSNLELQEKCAKHAQDFFEHFTSTENETNGSFSNHYNSKLEKCFILIDHSPSDKNKFISEELLDAIEKKSYGSYVIGPDNKGAWNVIYCSVKVDGTEEGSQNCKTADEFEKLINKFMEN